jgi:two-component system nitrate/nitrite sensor histidine kinase NarQ
MTYKQIKWLILTIPTLTIGIWEYVRHEFLLPYISMELGNFLAPVVVFLVTMVFLTQLFRMIEQHQEELNQTRALQAVLEERELIARELHDGIAQSLFFLNAQISKMEKMPKDEVCFDTLKESIFRANDYVRQAIANLRYSAEIGQIPWMQGLMSLIEEIRRESDLQISLEWEIPEEMLTPKEKVELLAVIREALLNVHKHAEARHVRLKGYLSETGWVCSIADDGKGFDPSAAASSGHYGLRMMKDRADMMKWQFSMERTGNETRVMVRKELY